MKKIVLIIIVVFLHSVLVAQESVIERDLSTKVSVKKILFEKESELSHYKVSENVIKSNENNDASAINSGVIETTDIICKELIPLLLLTVKKIEQ